MHTNIRLLLTLIQKEAEKLDLRPLWNLKKDLAKQIEHSLEGAWNTEDEYHNMASLLCIMDDLEGNVDLLKEEVSRLV
jgi:hypothetical protein